MQLMSADYAELDKINYPLMGSPKLDGIRAAIIGGTVMSKSFKPIPNKYVQSLFGKHEYNMLDGELIVGSGLGQGAFQDATSGIMSVGGEPDVTYHVFDYISREQYWDRYTKVIEMIPSIPHAKLVEQVELCNEEQLLAYEKQLLGLGHEGVILRDTYGKYKYGRSTVTQGWLLKLKRFVDSEAVILSTNQLARNLNDEFTDELGYTARSSHSSGKVYVDMLGSFTAKDIHTGIVFNCGGGFTEDQRKDFWQRRAEMPGQLFKYKSQKVGVKVKPRIPIFLGFRSRIDM